jgi:hypothetical protein
MRGNIAVQLFWRKIDFSTEKQEEKILPGIS